ncbi:MOXD1 homolog 2-like [Bactrocera tryoni]|uniref:MOXD1 homolog 2-like n=1 Tax=Bactrocera tryoni TaxID=59916 RepID=UPI001A9846F1|nr:MOXD1 homolog 2-like [Bactrocera tryoni]
MAQANLQNVIYVIKALQCWLFLSYGFSQLKVADSRISGMTSPLEIDKSHQIIDLDDNFRLLWTITDKDAMFEVQVRTHGYVGFGFSANGRQEGADIVIGWVDKGQTFFQDRHVSRTVNSTEPQVDASQDYVLLKGYENTTHTIIRFRRKLDTCDSVYDIPITNNTMRLMFLYDENDPPNSLVSPGSLPNIRNAWRQSRSVVLTERPIPTQSLENTRKLEFRNSGVELPYDDETLIWCKFFKLNEMKNKNHIIKYEPIFDSSWSVQYLQYITLYECQGSGAELEALAHEPGQQCHNIRSSPLSQTCTTYIASWSRGNSEFVYPPEVGYPLETNNMRFVMMETHYNNLNIDFEQFKINHMFDSSGLMLHITEKLRAHDAGLMSIGIEPNWHHIIPPSQKRVVSQGHCIEQCTGSLFPTEGIDIFATMSRTHQIGVEVNLRQIRETRELAPIIADSNIDPNYQAFRRLPQATRSLPGDRLIAECVYDTSSRQAITLGGPSMKEESCMIFALYYPKQKKLTSCHSSPSLSTVLHSLGIEYLNANSDPVVISLPVELKGMTLEERLLTYDWDNQFKAFQDITLKGAFKAVCEIDNSMPKVSNALTSWPTNITDTYEPPTLCSQRAHSRTNFEEQNTYNLNEVSSNDLVASSVRNSRSSFSETLALSREETVASSTRRLFGGSLIFLVLTLIIN